MLAEQQAAAEKRMNEALETQQAAMAAQQAATNERMAELIAQLARAPVQQAAVAANSLHNELAERMLPFKYNADDNSTFEKYFSRYERIFTVSAATFTDAEKMDLLTEKMNSEDFELFANTIKPLKKETIPFADAIVVLKRIFGKKESQFMLRYKCLKIQKGESESFNEYTARVNLAVEKFDLASLTADDMKVVMFVQGLVLDKDAHALEKLLVKLDEQEKKREVAADPANVPVMTLQDVNGIANRLASLKVEKSMVTSSNPMPEVMAIQHQPFQNKKSPKSGFSGYAPSSVSGYAPSSATIPSTSSWRQPAAQASQWTPSPCKFCGGQHLHRECPFREKACSTCSVTGHKSGFCKSAADERERMSRKFSRSNRNSTFRRSNQVLINSINENRRFVTPGINGTTVRLQLDSASDWTIISKKNHERIGSPQLLKCRPDERAQSASGNFIQIRGKFHCKAQINGKTHSGLCYVAEKEDLNIFGNSWMQAMGLYDVPINSICNSIDAGADNSIKAKFPALFEKTLGLCNKMQASLTLKPGATGVFRRARPVPFAVQELVEAELKRLQLTGVFTPIDFAECAAPIVVVKRPDGRIRICADYSTGLNDALEPNKHPMPSTEDVHTKLALFRKMSKVDLSDAFLQVELDEEAKKLAVINTHCGLMQVNRLQPGIKTAPPLFQQLMDTIMSGAKGVFCYIDDLIIGGATEQEHDENLNEALRRLQDAGFKLKIEKCEFKRDTLKFLGLVIDKHGVKPNPEKIAVIQNLPAPIDVPQLQSFLGAVTWYGKFISGMRELRGPLDELLCKDVKFSWESMHQKAFEQIKKVLSSELALVHYDTKKPLILAADASSYGIGAVLMHKMPDGTERPIMYASTSLNKAEKNYSQIEREALGLVFGVKYFHSYIFGRKFELRTDHKPLLAIFGSKTGIPVITANRLQRYALILLAYDFNIRYISSESFAYADFVSRLVKKTDRPDEDVIIAAIRVVEQSASCFSVETARLLPIAFEEIQQETKADENLQKVIQRCVKGWPRHSKGLEPEIAPFFGRRNEFSIIEECLFFMHRIVIPKKLQKKILDELHDGHPGVERMKLVARSKVYWPMIDNDIENTVRRCDLCAVNAKSPKKTSLQAWPIPKTPWSRIHIDYAGPVNSFFYLVIVDALSNWPEIYRMTSTTTGKTIEKLQETFARQGLPDTLVSDNGPQFKSEEFESFCKQHGIEHLTSAPYHPQSNGRAERFVDLLKTGLKKLEREGNVEFALQKFLFCYRRTPSPSLGGKSPFEIMTGRSMKTRIDLVMPSDKNTTSKNTKMEQQFNDHHGAIWKTFEVGDEVYVKQHEGINKFRWTPGTIIGRLGSVNYSVWIESRKIQAHANQLKMRFNTVDLENSNELLDQFDIQFPMPLEVQIQPENNRDDAAAQQEDEIYEETTSEEEIEDTDEEAAVEEPIPATPRRTTRANVGQTPRRLADYQLN